MLHTALLAAALANFPHTPSAPPPNPNLPHLLTALRTRDDHGLYLDAASRLADLGDQAIPSLETALLSESRFERQLAAHALRRIKGYVPSDRLLSITIEGLVDDDIPTIEEGRRPAGFLTYNAREGLHYLIEHADHAKALLAAAMQSGDAQQEALAAIVVAAARLTEGSASAIRILVSHLPSNRTPGDSALAEMALCCFSSASIQQISDAGNELDKQGSAAIARVLANLGHQPGGASPTESIDQREERLAIATDKPWSKQMAWRRME